MNLLSPVSKFKLTDGTFQISNSVFLQITNIYELPVNFILDLNIIAYWHHFSVC